MSLRRHFVVAGITLSTALTAVPAFADALATLAMQGPLAANSEPFNFDAGPLGTLYVSGMMSAIGFWQDNPAPGNRDTRFDISNVQVSIQKPDGFFQFYVQAGQYDILSLGTPTVSSSYFTKNGYGYVPQAYVKLAPSNDFSVEIGKLPTLIGDEDTFSLQNPNMERGLLWNQTNGQVRGMQANYTVGPVAVSLSWNDGYYSGRYTWLSGLATWSIDSADTLSFLGAGNAGRSASSSFITPLLQNNQDIFDLMYTRTSGPWTINPYFQYSHVPQDTEIGIDGSGDTRSAAVLAIYNVDPNWNLAARAEYIDTTGSVNLLEGPRSHALSFTVTPTFQYKLFFARAEASYVIAGDVTPGETTFGGNGTKSDQFRALVEAGVIF